MFISDTDFCPTHAALSGTHRCELNGNGREVQSVPGMLVVRQQFSLYGEEPTAVPSPFLTYSRSLIFLSSDIPHIMQFEETFVM
jgi:hypothetical protein